MRRGPCASGAGVAAVPAASRRPGRATLRITRSEAWTVRMRLAEPYTIAYETVDAAVNVFFAIETDEGHVGYGCAAPDPGVTGETPEATLAALRDTAEPVLHGRNPLRWVRRIEELKPLLAGKPSSLAAVDMALLDILGKRAGLPLYEVLGGYRDRMATSITIGILPLDETVAKANEFIAARVPVPEAEGRQGPGRGRPSRATRCAQAVGPDIEIRFDANQGYTLEGAQRFVEAARAANLELLEQPTPRGEPGLLGRVTESVALPIMADESLMNLRDAFALASDELADMVNVKLMKVGGITEAIRVGAVARAAGLEVMVGCMDESALGICAGLHYALARPNVKYADLDGHLDLLDDPAVGAVILENGELRPTGLPGLGFDPPRGGGS